MTPADEIRDGRLNRSEDVEDGGIDVDDVPIEDSRSIGDETVTIHAARVRLAVVRREVLYDAFEVDEETQYVLLGVSRDPDSDDRSSEWTTNRFIFDLDGDRHDPLEPSVEILPQDPLDGSTAVAFPVPADAAPEEVTARWTDDEDGDDSAEWELGPQIADRLRSSPSFELTSVDVPDQSPSGALEFSFAVRNDGDRDGWFLLWVSLPTIEEIEDYHPWECITVPVPESETVTRRETVTWNPSPGSGSAFEEEATVGLRWPHGSTGEAVTFEPRLNAGSTSI